MKFNPITRHLYTDSGTLIKTLDCPVALRRDDIREDPLGNGVRCGRCTRTIVDTGCYSDNELARMVRADSSTCLKVDLHQANVRILNHHG
jgi:hypothetical protein